MACPAWAQTIGEVLPLTHFLRIVRGILLKGNALPQIAPELWPMLAFMLVAGLVALKRYRQTVDSSSEKTFATGRWRCALDRLLHSQGGALIPHIFNFHSGNNERCRQSQFAPLARFSAALQPNMLTMPPTCTRPVHVQCRALRAEVRANLAGLPSTP